MMRNFTFPGAGITVCTGSMGVGAVGLVLLSKTICMVLAVLG